MSRQDKHAEHLPACVAEYINHVIRRMRYSRSARREIRQELIDHFTDALADCSDPREREKLAQELIAEFGNAKLLAMLLRRAKKRNRPAWLKALIRTGQAFLIFIGLFILYTAWFFHGGPTITTNYIALLSEKVQPKAPESENAWPLYKQAALAFIRLPGNSPSGTQLPPQQQDWINAAFDVDTDTAHMPAAAQAMLGKWIDQNESAWQKYVAAGKRTSNWCVYEDLEDLLHEMVKADAAREGRMLPANAFTTDPDDPWNNSMISMPLTHLSPIRYLSKAGIWKARLATASGHPDEAMSSLLAVGRAGRHWQNPNAIVIEQLVGAAINNLACGEIRRLAQSDTLTAADLRKVQEELDSLYKNGYPALGVEAERLGFIDTIQRSFTQGGLGGGHPIPRLISVVLSVSKGPAPTNAFKDDVRLVAGNLAHAGRDETLATGNAFYDRVAEGCRLSPWQRKDSPDPQGMIKSLSEPRYWVLRVLMPSFSKEANRMYEAQAEYEATLTVLALQRYRLDKGQYPPSLEVLVETGCLRQIPTDPYSNGLLIYRRTGETFTLYSVGNDFRDDGGMHNPDNPWGLSQAGASTQPKPGDRVFWPVPRLKPFPTEEGAR